MLWLFLVITKRQTPKTRIVLSKIGLHLKRCHDITCMNYLDKLLWQELWQGINLSFYSFGHVWA